LPLYCYFFFFQQKDGKEFPLCFVGSEVVIREQLFIYQS